MLTVCTYTYDLYNEIKYLQKKFSNVLNLTIGSSF